MRDEMEEQVALFNKYDDRKMEVIRHNQDYFYMYIDDEEITSGDSYDIYQRVRDINRSHAYNHLGG